MPFVIVTVKARADVVRLRGFLLENSPLAANRLGNTIADAIDRLKTHPRLGRPVESVLGLHRLVIPFGVNSYVLHYHYLKDEDGVQVLRLRHSKETEE